MKKEILVKEHVLVPKHIKLSEEQKQKLLEKYNVSIKQLPSILEKDPAIADLDAKPGDIIEITRNSPTAGHFKFCRVVING